MCVDVTVRWGLIGNVNVTKISWGVYTETIHGLCELNNIISHLILLLISDYFSLKVCVK